MLTSIKRTNLATDISLLLVRLVFGLAMVYNHGWSKFMRFFSEGPLSFRDPIGLGPELSLGLASFAEVFCAGALVLGLFTRLATIPLIITMGVAIFIVHINDPIGKWELPMMYLVVYVSILLMGPGKYSLDSMIKK